MTDTKTEICPDCGAVASIWEETERGMAGPVTLTCGNCGYELQLPETTTANTRIEALRDIVETHGARRMEGFLMDAFTASMLVQVYDALDRPGRLFERKPEMRDNFNTMPLMRLVDFGWKQVK